MKQVIEAHPDARSLEHSMIDENTRKGWEYYEDHSDRQSQLAQAAASSKGQGASPPKKHLVS